MSGHSKWSKVKHQKEATDAVKGKIFTKMAANIIIAVKEGGGNTDPSSNFKLRLAIEKAKSVNTPKDNIVRAIERANKSENIDLSEIIYEAFGPFGIGMLIKTATDNKQRTVSELKNTLDKNGGVLAEAGSVAHLFNKIGRIQIKRDERNLDKIMEFALDSGADDVSEQPELFNIYTKSTNLHGVREKLESFGLIILSAEQYFQPQVTIQVPSDKESQIENLLNLLEERADVLKVYSNHSLHV